MNRMGHLHCQALYSCSNLRAEATPPSAGNFLGALKLVRFFLQEGNGVGGDAFFASGET